MADTQAPVVPADLKARLKASYDAMAPTYNEWTIPHSQQRMEYLGKALDHLNPEARASSSGSDGLAFLELGCGCGLPVTKKLLSYRAARVVANDLSDTQVSLARENLIRAGDEEGEDVARRLELIQGDMTTLEFPDDSFDLVVGFYSLIHLPRAEQTALLARVARWLRPGGHFVANFAKEELEGVVMEKWLDEKGWMYWSAWGEEKTLETIRAAGLEIVVADVVEDVVDASFLWVVARR
ncbi:S-adenosyl-L-methionine-dependent methyltransferase [Nemania sp. NC0429]|nr:S-adenosyl-L-methionine-dependent methyltransferase [Nemania sp. NC0429]